MRSRRLEALVLSLSDFGEGHRLVRLFTREEGLIRAFAPGARRSRRRFGGTLEPMARLEVVLTERPGRDLPVLDEARALSLHLGLRAHLDRILLGTYLVELCSLVVREGQAQPDLWDLARAALEGLDVADSAAAEGSAAGVCSPWGRVALELGVLAACGRTPRFDVCVCCGRAPKADRSRFSVREGGLLCPRCEPRRWPDDRLVTRRTLRALDALLVPGDLVAGLARAAVLPQDDLEAHTEARDLLADLLDATLGRVPRSRALLEG